MARESISRIEAAVAAAGSTLRQRGANVFRSRGDCHDGDDPETLVWLYSPERGHTNPHCHKQCDREVILSRYRLTEADLFDEPRKKGGALSAPWVPTARIVRPPRPEPALFEPSPPKWYPDDLKTQRHKVEDADGNDVWVNHRVAAEYLYRDELWRVVFGVIRCECKAFRQWHPEKGAPNGGRRLGTREYDKQTKELVRIVKSVPYRLPQVLGAVRDEQVVWIAEGEKDVNAIVSAGLTATCCAGGSGMGWDPGCTPYFAGAYVCIVPDRDPAGRKLAEQIIRALTPVARSIEVVLPKSGNDVSDHIDAGHQTWEFVKFWTPKPLALEGVAQ
jgi:hypothetical protein